MALPGDWSEDRLEQLLAVLDDFDPSSVEEQPDCVRVFFASAVARDAALAHLGGLGSVSCLSEDVPDENWAERSQAALTPIVVGRLTIAPPWTVTPEMRAQAPGPVVIIQPSMGFGTGHHASTRLCLHWLQHVPLSEASVLDVGTGSGVLAICAKVLGAGLTVGVDIDPDALTNARENLDLNDLSAAVELREFDLSAGASASGRTFDVITANLTGGLLCRDAAALTAFANPGARLIASGFQAHEAADVIGAFTRVGWTFRSQAVEQDWVGALFFRDAAATTPILSTAH